MKRSTAIRHLVEMAEVASEHANLARSSVDWPLSEMWVAGQLLERTGEVDHATVVLMIDLPPDELPWLAVHPTAEWIGERVRLGKRPMLWSYRPAAWPPWTYRDRRVARFWSTSSGLEHGLIDQLQSGVAPTLIEPGQEDVNEQVSVELEVAKAHLRPILDQYWDRDWRRATAMTPAPKTNSGVPPPP